MWLKLVVAAVLLAASIGLDLYLLDLRGMRRGGTPTTFLMIALTASVLVGLLLRQDWARKLVPLLAGIHLLGVVLWCSVLVKEAGWTPRSEMGLLYAFIGVDLLCAFLLPWLVTRPDLRQWFARS